MSIFEEILLGLLKAGATFGPVFIHSTKGVAILNASEEFLTGVVQQVTPASPATPPAQ